MVRLKQLIVLLAIVILTMPVNAAPTNVHSAKQKVKTSASSLLEKKCNVRSFINGNSKPVGVNSRMTKKVSCIKGKVNRFAIEKHRSLLSNRFLLI